LQKGLWKPIALVKGLWQKVCGKMFFASRSGIICASLNGVVLFIDDLQVSCQ